MSTNITSRIDRWIAHFGEPMGPGRANPDNDTIYLLTDTKAEIERLRSALGSARGYMLNAKIDLETHTPKRTAIQTLDSGLRMIDEVLKKGEGR